MNTAIRSRVVLMVTTSRLEGRSRAFARKHTLLRTCVHVRETKQMEKYWGTCNRQQNNKLEYGTQAETRK
eukprot:6151003-Pleurochrysis_carterae.AAC.1